jgi:hypothetical protein
MIAVSLLLWCCYPLRAQENAVPVFSVSAGYIYLNAEETAAPRASLNGWYAIPQYFITPHWSAIAEFANYYGSPGGKSTNIHGYTFGPVYAFPFAHHSVRVW